MQKNRSIILNVILVFLMLWGPLIFGTILKLLPLSSNDEIMWLSALSTLPFCILTFRLYLFAKYNHKKWGILPLIFFILGCIMVILILLAGNFGIFSDMEI